jgi:MoxR-like ATPase
LNDRSEVDLMDCFLIQHCIWSEDSEKDAVYQFVREAVEKYGYTVSISFSDMKQELGEFKTEIDEETKFVKDTRVELLEPVHNEYYEILNPPNSNSNLIRKSDFDSLTNANVSKYLYYYERSYKQVRQYSSYDSYDSYDLRTGNSEFTVFINDTSYDLKTVMQGDKRQKTKKPHPSVEKDWDGRVDGFLQAAKTWQEQIETYREKDLEHLRANLFVKPELANVVESHIAATIKEIEKIEIDIREIQNSYKRLKDEEIIIIDEKNSGDGDALALDIF